MKKEAAYFQQAFADRDYRRQKILETREHRQMTGGFSIVIGVLFAGITLYGGIAEGHWFTGFGSLFSTLVLMLGMYVTATTRLAALEAMDGKVSSPAADPQAKPVAG